MELIKVINPDYQKVDLNALKTKANDYKFCKISGDAYLPFGDMQEIRFFSERVRNNYRAALNDMIGFVNDFLDLGKAVSKAVQLARELIDLIQRDESVAMSEEFFIRSDGQRIKKTALGGLDEVYLPAFLLGIWHYAVVNRKDNTVGQDTYNTWCPPVGGDPRVYSARMDKGILDGLSVYYVNTEDTPHFEVEYADHTEAEIVDPIP